MANDVKVLSDYSDILTTKDLSEILKVSSVTIRKMLKNNEIPSIKIGREYRVSKKTIIKFLECI